MVPLIYGPGPGEPAPLRMQPDLKGLPADDAAGKPLGEVFGVLNEDRSGLIRYLDLSVSEDGRHVLVPIGHVRFEDRADGTRVRLRAAAREDLRGIPAFDPEAPELGDAYQSQVLMEYGKLFYGERYYAHPAFDHKHLYVGEHPIVPDSGDSAAAESPESGLGLLSRMVDWKVARGEPDVRGWNLRGGDGEPVGRVADLVVDPAAAKVRYLLVRQDGRRPRAVPVGYASIDRERSLVTTPALGAEDFAALPSLAGDAPPTRDQEEAVRGIIEGRLSGRRRFQRPDFASPRD